MSRIYGPIIIGRFAITRLHAAPSMEHHRKLVLTSLQAIRWGDQDAMGHVNNTVYFRYIEQARIEWLEQLG